MTAVAHNPRAFIAYAPRAGLRCALVYLASETDVYGWYTGPNGANALESRYFVLEDFYTAGATRSIAIRDDDLHAGWTDDEARCHELAELQDAFVHEWLFYRAEPGAVDELAKYASAELAVGDVNVKFERLGRFSHQQPAWTFASPGFDMGVLQYLAARWPLDAARESARQYAAAI